LPPSSHNRLRHLERGARPHTRCFRLEDGSRYYYQPQEVAEALFVHSASARRAQYLGEPLPAPPEILRAVARAKDRRRAAELVLGGEFSAFYDHETLIEQVFYL
jgi:hypothetical protein